MIKRIATILLLLAAGNVAAEGLVEGSIDAGKNKSMTCSACHGAEGISVNPEWPNIAGQHAKYTYRQLQAFKTGDRANPLMSSQAMLLSDDDMQDLAAYFESLPAAANSVADPTTLARGEALYRGGDTDRGIAACLACHGPAGRGNAAANYPSLNGQHAVYTAKQLRDYASGTRASDGTTQVMRNIASRLSEEDIVALASYVQGLR